MAGSMEAAASKLMKYNIDLVAVQEVRWVDSGSQLPDNYTFFHVNGNANFKNLKSIDHLADLGIDGKTESEWTLGKQGVRTWTGFI